MTELEDAPSSYNRTAPAFAGTGGSNAPAPAGSILGMTVPLVLIVLATVAAAVLAYGTDPTWAQFSHGIDVILWSRRLQWPLIVVALLLCLALLALVIAAKRRAWWLVALLPIL